MKYEDIHYAVERLRDTFIWHKNKLLQVRDSDGNHLVCIDEKRSYVNVPLGQADLAPPPLGYVNTDDSACFCARGAMRRDYRQGMRPSNLQWWTNSDYEYQPRTEDLFFLQPTCANKYPTFKQAAFDIEESHVSRAFLREFCLDEEGNVRHRGRKWIGRIRDERGFDLLGKYHYLQDTLREQLAGQNVEIRMV